MPDFVRNHIRLREVARGLEPPLQFFKEGEIEIHLAIAGAVKRTTRRTGKAHAD